MALRGVTGGGTGRGGGAGRLSPIFGLGGAVGAGGGPSGAGWGGDGWVGSWAASAGDTAGDTGGDWGWGACGEDGVGAIPTGAGTPLSPSASSSSLLGACAAAVGWLEAVAAALAPERLLPPREPLRRLRRGAAPSGEGEAPGPAAEEGSGWAAGGAETGFGASESEGGPAVAAGRGAGPAPEESEGVVSSGAGCPLTGSDMG